MSIFEHWVFVDLGRPRIWQPSWLSYERRAAVDQGHPGPIESDCVVSDRDAVWPFGSSQLHDPSLCS